MQTISLDIDSFLSDAVILSRLNAYFTPDILRDKRLLLVCEDVTRATPIASWFPAWLDGLLPQVETVTVLFALGTHRPMTHDEMLDKLGLTETRAESLTLMNHNAFDESHLVDVGEIDGLPLKLNRALCDHDVVVTLASIIPHRVTGFSGGGKMLCPGIGNKAMIDHTHWKCNNFSEQQVMIQVNNPMRAVMDEITDCAYARFPETTFVAVNAVSLPDGIIDLYIGDIKTAFAQAAQHSYEVFVRPVERCTKILALVDDKCVDFWQAAKAVYNVARALEEGGTVVVRALMPEGVSPVHGADLEKIGYSTPETIRQQFAAGLITNQVAASHMIRVSEHTARVNVVLASEHISPETCKRLNLGYLAPEDVNPDDYDYVVYNPVDIVLTRG